MTDETIIFFIGMFIILVIGVYLLPSIIAFSRNTELKWILLIANIIFGATVVGWFICLVCSVVLEPVDVTNKHNKE